LKKLSFAILFIALLCLAIWQTDSEAWLTAWFLLFFFVSIPLLLLAIRDALISVKPKWLGRGPLLLHTCAVFAAFVGYLVGWMAVDSEHPRAHLHQAMVVIFPLLVYATPLLMIFHGMPISQLKYFYYARDPEKEPD
jgi:phosphatidylglycerophosphate synthase